MLILLPPSESKSSPDGGPRLNLTELFAPELTKVRRLLLDGLIRMCAKEPRVALRSLALSDRQLGEVNRNTALKQAPCAPAAEIYTGVLFDALCLSNLPRAARSRANERVLIASAFFGAIRPEDLIPAYRLSAGSRVTGIDSLNRMWKSPLGLALETRADGRVVLDLRSSDYAALAQVPSSLAERTVIGKVVDSSTGRKIAVSHFNKATKGYLTRELLRSAKTPHTPDSLAAMCEAAGFEVNLLEPSKVDAPWTLEIEQHHG